MSSTIDEDALNQLKGEQSELLDKIDELRTLGVGGLVELPQIVVCGNQSSGKSSVLEAISRVRFPAKSNICTRFATEIVLRRHPSNKVKVSIEPGRSRKDLSEREKLRAFTSESFFSSEDLPALIESAKECMGLSSTDVSDDVLKVEISGPDRPELTLVDLPGLYYSTSDDQGESGIQTAQILTENYMKNSRTIILAVISARYDYHIQKVLNLAQKFDPKYERVLGIVTQPDRPEAGSDDEEYYLKLIWNDKVKLQLGWHVLRNRSFETMNVSDDARDLQEKRFFETGHWASLPRRQVGIENLRHRLSTILLAHIRRNIPGLILDIQEKIVSNEQELAKLGTSRTSTQEQRRFLVKISSKFTRITNQAVNGSYNDEFLKGYERGFASSKELPFRRLRAVVRELNECFAHAMNTRGCQRIIQYPMMRTLNILEEWSKPYMDGWSPTYITRESLKEELKEQARESRGVELPGSPNQLLVGRLFKDQCEPWKKIAESHLLNVWSSVEYFVQLVFQYLVDDHARASLMRHLISPELEKMKKDLMAKLEELISHYNRGHPLPVGDSFLTKMLESRKKRQLAILTESLDVAKHGTLNDVDLEKAANSLYSSNDEFGAEEIIDQMQAYYDTTIITFVQNVAILAIENCLLFPLEDIFSPQTVVSMDDQQVQKVAAEPSETQRERARLNEELEKLRLGRETLEAYRPNEISLPKPPAMGLPNSQPQGPRVRVRLPHRDAAQAAALPPQIPKQPASANFFGSTAQKANVAQPSLDAPSINDAQNASPASAGLAVPAPKSTSSPFSPSPKSSTSSVQPKAEGVKGLPFGFGSSSLFGGNQGVDNKSTTAKTLFNSSAEPNSFGATRGFGTSIFDEGRKLFNDVDSKDSRPKPPNSKKFKNG
ncbi:dynamin family protein [Penicillium brasilianum]|uniref:Dynamin family protein n=1 Tax=Penicillium brasilianum TaxID=104259 RepID=A0A1S9RDP3_PENBI|nr:dynamin family protein [Penicillium brasilianum]